MTTDIKEMFDEPRQIMWDEIADEFGEGMLEDEMVETMRRRLTELYDNRDKIRSQKQ
jgi:hypothetical protein